MSTSEDERTLAIMMMARCLVMEAFRQAVAGHEPGHIAVIVVGMARQIAIELLEMNHGMERPHARKLVDEQARMLESMSDTAAREAGLE